LNIESWVGSGSLSSALLENISTSATTKYARAIL